MAPCQRPCPRPAERAAAAYLSLTRNRNGMTTPWYVAPRGHRTTGFSYAFSPQLHFPVSPGLRGPPPPPPSGRNNGDMAFRPGAMQVFRPERQNRLCFRQHAATVDASPQQSQAGLEAEKQSARDLEVLLPAEERGSSSNSLSVGARPFGMSIRAPASSSGRSEAGTVCSTSISISLQSSTNGGQDMGSQLKACAKPYVPGSRAAWQQPHAQSNTFGKPAKSQVEAVKTPKMQPYTDYKVHSKLFPEVDSSLSKAAAMSLAAAQRKPAQLAGKPVLLPTSLCSAGTNTAHINTAAAEGQAQLETSIGSMHSALTPDSSGSQPSTSFDHSVGMQVAQGRPAVQQVAAAHPALARKFQGMPSVMFMSPAMHVGPPGLPQDFISTMPGLQPPPPPPPPVRNSGVSSNRAIPAGKSINSLNGDARPFRASFGAAAPSSGESQASLVSSPSSRTTPSVQSSATGGRDTGSQLRANAPAYTPLSTSAHQQADARQTALTSTARPQGPTEAAQPSKLQPDTQCRRVHSRLFPEVDSSLSTAAAISSAADHRQPAQLADKPVPLPTPLGSSGSDAAHINPAAAEGQAQLGIGSIHFAPTSDSSGRQPSASFDCADGMQAAKGQPSTQQRTAVYPRLAPSLKGMPHVSPAATMHMGPQGLTVDFISSLPGLQPPPPPPPPPLARNSNVSRGVAPQAGHMHAFTSQRQGRLLLPQHAARANSHHQFLMQPAFQQRPARHAEVQLSLGERGHIINSLGRHARPFRSSSRATPGSSQVGRVSSLTSSTSSLQSSATGSRDLPNVESQLKANARPYTPRSCTAHLRPPAQQTSLSTSATSQGSIEAAPFAKLQLGSQYQQVHALLFPEAETSLPTAAARSPDAAQIGTAAASAADCAPQTTNGSCSSAASDCDCGPAAVPQAQAKQQHIMREASLDSFLVAESAAQPKPASSSIGPMTPSEAQAAAPASPADPLSGSGARASAAAATHAASTSPTAAVLEASPTSAAVSARDFISGMTPAASITSASITIRSSTEQAASFSPPSAPTDLSGWASAQKGKDLQLAPNGSCSSAASDYDCGPAAVPQAEQQHILQEARLDSLLVAESVAQPRPANSSGVGPMTPSEAQAAAPASAAQLLNGSAAPPTHAASAVTIAAPGGASTSTIAAPLQALPSTIAASWEASASTTAAPLEASPTSAAAAVNEISARMTPAASIASASTPLNSSVEQAVSVSPHAAPIDPSGWASGQEVTDPQLVPISSSHLNAGEADGAAGRGNDAAAEQEHQAQHTAPLPASMPSVAQSSTKQLQSYIAQKTKQHTRIMAQSAGIESCNAPEAPHAKGKPGLLAKTVFCTVFSPVLVPVLVVGGCLQVYDALRSSSTKG